MTRSSRPKGARKSAKTETMDDCHVSLVAVSPAHHYLVAALHGLCFDDAWSAPTVSQVMNMKGVFGYTAQIEAQAGAPGGNGASGAALPEPTGFVLCHLIAEECEILSLGVAPEYRGRGIGARLVKAAVDKARILGAKRLFLEVAEDNETARWLYTALGFTPVGRRLGYYKRNGAASVAALTLRLDVTSGPTG
ncbi:MAG: GNAT family N-acetyltransferase [Alphaproteobacteria bacterium]